MDICVVGAGYVGLVTSACLAYLGNDVVTVEVNPERLSKLKSGTVPFFEPGLEEFVRTTVESGRLDFTDQLDECVKRSEVIFICVGTPPLDNGESDLSQVMKVARDIGAALDSKQTRVIINKSTVPVGSGNWVEMLVNQGVKTVQTVPARSARTEAPFFSVVSNPEFLREGSAIADSLYPDRIVVGSSDGNATELMRKLYQSIVNQDFAPPEVAPRPKGLGHVPFVVTDLASAELIKYSANAFLAMKISFANEIAGLCEKVGADIKQVTLGMGLDERIGSQFLNAGVGWGGSCFHKDITALMQVARDYKYPTELLQSTITVNVNQRLVPIKKLQDELKIIKGRTVGLLGLAFKPNTDDLRDAPSLTIARQLIKMGVLVKAYDPVAIEVCKAQHADLEITYCESLLDTATDADALILVTEWDEFKNVDWREVSKVMRWPLLIDGRNALNGEAIAEMGMTYRGIGR